MSIYISSGVFTFRKTFLPGLNSAKRVVFRTHQGNDREFTFSANHPHGVTYVGTVEEVLTLMEAEWVHFTCHEIQDAARQSTPPGNI